MCGERGNEERRGGGGARRNHEEVLTSFGLSFVVWRHFARELQLLYGFISLISLELFTGGAQLEVCVCREGVVYVCVCVFVA